LNKRAVGTEYEEKAAKKLSMLGYKIIEKNFYCKGGEIDIIARNEGYLCFIEVKYRFDESEGDPLEAVDLRKIKRICKCAVYYLTKNGYAETTPVRFDVVAILGEEIKVIKNAFDYI
jgi:putative endonuclease